MAIIPTNVPGQKSDFNAAIFTDGVAKSMLLCVPKTEGETIFRVIPEINAQGQPVPMCRTFDATGHDFSSMTLESAAVGNGVIGKFTGSIFPARPGDTSGAPDYGIPEPDLPFKGLYIRLKGRLKKNQVPIELQSSVTQMLTRGPNRPAPLDVSQFVLVQAWILKDNGVLCVDPTTKQPVPRRGVIMLKSSAAQGMKQLLTELFTAGIDAYDPNAGVCFMISGFPPKTFPGQELAVAFALPCTMSGIPLTFRGHTPPPAPAGRPPVQYSEFSAATASPLPPSFWQGANAFVDWNKMIRRYTLQELFKKQLGCFGPSICQFAFPNEYGAPAPMAQQPGFQQQPQQPAFGQPVPQQGFQAPQQQPSFGQVPQQPVQVPQQGFQAPQQPLVTPQQAFGQQPAQMSQPTFPPAQGQPQQPAFGQQPQQPQQGAFGAPPLQQAVQQPQAPQQPAFGQQAPQQPVAGAFGQPPMTPQQPQGVPVVAVQNAADLQAAFAAAMGTPAPGTPPVQGQPQQPQQGAFGAPPQR